MTREQLISKLFSLSTYSTCNGFSWCEVFLSSRSVELNGFMAFRDQYMGMSVPPHYQYIPHLFSYSGHSPLLPPQARSLDPQSYSLIHQLMSAEDLEPLGTPMLIEDGWVNSVLFGPLQFQNVPTTHRLYPSFVLHVSLIIFSQRIQVTFQFLWNWDSRAYFLIGSR